jgi:hypothetical protein
MWSGTETFAESNFSLSNICRQSEYTFTSGESLLHGGGAVGIDICDGDELQVLAGGQGADVRRGHAAGADADVQHGLARRGVRVGAEDERRRDAGGDALQRGSASDTSCGHGNLLGNE